MRMGVPVHLEMPVSGQLLDGIAQIQARFSEWATTRSVIPVEADPRSEGDQAAGERRIASLISGDVDSFFTLYEHLDEIDDIIFLHGLDVPLDRVWLRRRSSRLFR